MMQLDSFTRVSKCAFNLIVIRVDARWKAVTNNHPEQSVIYTEGSCLTKAIRLARFHPEL